MIWQHVLLVTFITTDISIRKILTKYQHEFVLFNGRSSAESISQIEKKVNLIRIKVQDDMKYESILNMMNLDDIKEYV